MRKYVRPRNGAFELDGFRPGNTPFGLNRKSETRLFADMTSMTWCYKFIPGLRLREGSLWMGRRLRHSNLALHAG